MDTEVPPSLQDTQMDEFESSKVLEQKPIQRNAIKIVKIGVIALVGLVIIGGGAVTFVLFNQKGANTSPASTPIASVQATVAPSATPDVQFPDEYKVISDKITRFDADVMNPSESRTRLNPPSMTISATFK